MRKYILTSLFSLTAISLSAAQMKFGYGPEEFVPPMSSRILLSANFAEVRSNHFHSGIDLKTGGAEGKSVYSIADGYVARIGIAPSGYGRVLYINHPNGTTSVYAHLSRFIPRIEEFVNRQRLSRQIHYGDFYPSKDQFVFKQGELIGYSGNSGMSFGPHLHFEIRETATQSPMNVPAMRIYDIKDDIPPTVLRLYYIETDSVAGVPVHSTPHPIELRKDPDGGYSPVQGELSVGPNFHFILEATDRKNDTQNTMGIYSVLSHLDGERIYSYNLDKFLFSDTRYVNSHVHYGLQKGSRNELIRLAVQQGNLNPIYGSLRDRGAVMLRDTLQHTIRIEVYDDSGNMEPVTVKVRRPGSDSGFRGERPEDSRLIRYNSNFNFNSDGMRLAIAPGTLYESRFYTAGVRHVTNIGSVKCLSPVYSVLDYVTPAHKNFELTIDASGVPEELRGRACLGIVSQDGTKITHAGGKYAGGKVSGKFRTFGDYVIVCDTVPPSVTPDFTDNADLSGRKSVKFTLKDDFSGIDDYQATIDGVWIPFERDILKGTITHFFDDAPVKYSGGSHTLKLTVTDNVGNNTVLERSFIR